MEDDGESIYRPNGFIVDLDVSVLGERHDIPRLAMVTFEEVRKSYCPSDR
jgi:hypothetical protein